MTGVCCGLKVSESGEGMCLLVLHAGVSTIRRAGVPWILSSMLLPTGVSAIGTGDDRMGKYCVEFTVCMSIKSSFTE